MNRKIKQKLKEHNLIISLMITAGCCAAAYFGAFFLRFDFGKVPPEQRDIMLVGLPIIMVCRIIFLIVFQSHRGLYRYVGMHDVVQLLKAVTAGSIAFFLIWMVFLNSTYFLSRSIYLIEWLLCIAFLVGLRMAVRLYRTKYRNTSPKENVTPCERVLIVGTGNAGEAIVRMIDSRFFGSNEVVGFIDADRTKKGSRIHGIPVLGPVEQVTALVEEYDIHTIVFSDIEPHPGFYQQVISLCEGFRLKFNVISVLQNISGGETKADSVRSLKIEDLLGRKPVELDFQGVKKDIRGMTVLVTGAGGSIGSELCRQIATMSPSRLILFDVGESALFEIERELRYQWPTLNCLACLSDIKNEEVVDRIFSATRPDYIYHAAAYKHVPLMEDHPDEAVLNNVLGTRLLAESARRYGCRRFVMISTDKAVRSTNIMGATKRLCERVVQAMNGGKTVFVSVRFGNVLGSNGSVIPTFQKQIMAGGPVTVTDPEMTRYFMTIPEAASLVLQCGPIATPDDIFVLDMGTPIKIMDLAKKMIVLSGLRVNTDIQIKCIGLRPGEKMHEELVAYGERLVPTCIPKVNVLKRNRSGDEDREFLTAVHELEQVALTRDLNKIRSLVWRMVESTEQRVAVDAQG